MTDAKGLTLSLVVAAANTHDIKLVVDTLDALQTGKPGKKVSLCLDKGYDAEWLAIYKVGTTSRTSSLARKNQIPAKIRTLKLKDGLSGGLIAG